MFCHLNKSNVSLRRFCTNIFKLRDKTDAFKQKLAFWDGFGQKGNTAIFSTLNVCLRSVGVISKELLYYHKLTFLEGNLRISRYYFPEYEDPRNETVYNSFDTKGLR